MTRFDVIKKKNVKKKKEKARGDLRSLSFLRVVYFVSSFFFSFFFVFGLVVVCGGCWKDFEINTLFSSREFLSLAEKIAARDDPRSL